MWVGIEKTQKPTKNRGHKFSKLSTADCSISLEADEARMGAVKVGGKRVSRRRGRYSPLGSQLPPQRSGITALGQYHLILLFDN